MAPRTTRSTTAAANVNTSHASNDYVHTGDRLGLGADAKNPSYIEDKDKIPTPGLLGIRWGKTPGEIDNLNRLVDAKCKYFLECHKKKGEDLPPEVKWVLDKHENGSTVYKERVTLWPAVMTVLHILNLCYQTYYNVGWKAMLTVAVFTFVQYDIFSGVLHVVHDNPLMIPLPVVGEPCLEFQWHHHIPQDLTSKSFLEVCGDLNMVTSLIFILYCNPWGPYKMLESNIGMTLISAKLLMAYFGQLCHAMSHMPAHRRPNWVVNFQKWGIMVSPKEHWGHHKNYDDNYCIGNGMWNPVLTPFLKFTNWVHVSIGSNETISAYCWLVGFLALAVFDVPVAAKLFEDYLSVPLGFAVRSA